MQHCRATARPQGGGAFVISFVVNGPGTDASADAIDALVATVARDVG